MDLSTKDDDGRVWDLSMADMRKRAVKRINKDKPLLIVGIPSCTDWSTMMGIHWGKLGQEEKNRRMKEARHHLRFCIKIYRHREVSRASSWSRIMGGARNGSTDAT